MAVWEKAKQTSNSNDPILKDTRTWLSELRDACEMNFDQPEEALGKYATCRWSGKPWTGATWRRRCGRVSKAERFGYWNCTDKEWLGWLDDLGFWKAGWKPGLDDENEA